MRYGNVTISCAVRRVAEVDQPDEADRRDESDTKLGRHDGERAEVHRGPRAPVGGEHVVRVGAVASQAARNQAAFLVQRDGLEAIVQRQVEQRHVSERICRDLAQRCRHVGL